MRLASLQLARAWSFGWCSALVPDAAINCVVRQIVDLETTLEVGDDSVTNVMAVLPAMNTIQSLPRSCVRACASLSTLSTVSPLKLTAHHDAASRPEATS